MSGQDVPESASSDLPAILTAQQAAALLNISLRTLRRYVKKDLIPVVVLPETGDRRSYRFDRERILRWAREGCQNPKGESSDA